MNDTVSNDRDGTTEHIVRFEIDPELECDLVVLPTGVYLRSVESGPADFDWPTRFGLAVLAHLRTSRRIALDEADETR